MIKVSQGLLGQAELELVAQAFDYGYYGHAHYVEQFESELQEFIGAPEVIAVGNGTEALHLALDACGIGAGDEVLVPSLTFVASYQAIAWTGARPVSCDIDPVSLLLDLDDARKRITARTRAIMPVHYAGNPCDMEAIRNLQEVYNLRVIEDAAHAFGTIVNGRRVGSFGDIACFSFDSIKNITCGEGGAIACRDPQLARRMRIKRTLGIERIPGRDKWYCEVKENGFRYHMSNINAAIGLVQLAQVESFISRRQEICRRYDKAFSNLHGLQLIPVDYSSVAPHIYVVRIKGNQRDPFMHFLQENSIETGVNYFPNHRHPLFAVEGESLPVTEAAFQEIVTMPLHCRLSDEDIGRVIEFTIKFFERG